MAGPERGEVQVGDRAVAWRQLGAGPPLVLVNGYAATADDWDPTFLGALGEGFTVVFPDHRGMGASPWGSDPTPLSIASMADDVLAVIDGLQLEEPAVVGWSMGGMVAQALVRRAPDRVRALGLLATDPGGPDAVLADPSDWARLLDASGTPREQATRLLGLLFPPEVAAPIDAQVGDLVAQAKARLDPDVLHAQEAAIDAWHATDPGPGPRLPVVVAAGALDVVIPAANAPLLAERWGAPDPTIYDGAGHAFMAQVPVELATLLKEHLLP